jgi:hypothetical protein
LAATTVALDLHQKSPQIQILTDNALSTNTLRNYDIDSLRYTHHPHKELLRQANALIKTRDENGLLTYIGKVKSHTGVTHNDDADAGARGVVDGDTLPDIIFTDANPQIGGLQTWPLIKVTHADNNCSRIKLTNLNADLRKIIKAQNHATPRTNITIYSTILRKTRETGADHNIRGYSTAPYKARRDSLEVDWVVHVHRCSRKHGLTPTCTKCIPPLNNTHILGGCKHNAKLRTKRHNSTFPLLHQPLQNTN